MNLKINVPQQLEEALRSLTAQKGFDVESFVLDAISEKLESTDRPTLAPNASAEDFGRWLDSWSKRFPVLSQPIDDSRESIYAGRDE